MENNQIGMGKLMYHPLESVFESTMEREGRDIEVFATGEIFKAFFRRNDDGNNMEDRITIFYGVDAPISQGSVIIFNDRFYILLNRETAENECYYKSSAIQCSGFITTNTGTVDSVPCYAYTLENGLAVSNGVITVLSGSMEFILEDEEYGRIIDIDDTFNLLGRTWKVENKYTKNRIIHLTTKVTFNTQAVVNYQIEITGLTEESYAVGDSAMLTAALYRNGRETDGTVIWSSSNTSVATIDENGSISFVGAGVVGFTALWEEAEYSVTLETMEVIDNSQPVSPYTVTISGIKNLRLGSYREYTFNLYLDEELIPVNRCTWTYEIECDFLQCIESVVTASNKVKIMYTDYDYAYQDIILRATETTTNTTGIAILFGKEAI